MNWYARSSSSKRELIILATLTLVPMFAVACVTVFYMPDSKPKSSQWVLASQRDICAVNYERFVDTKFVLCWAKGAEGTFVIPCTVLVRCDKDKQAPALGLNDK